MADILKIATVNINGIKATGRMRMLHDFIQKLLQEVTHQDFAII
jgi:exonuclease III